MPKSISDIMIRLPGKVIEAESAKIVERIRTVADRGGGILFLFSAGDEGLEQFKMRCSSFK